MKDKHTTDTFSDISDSISMARAQLDSLDVKVDGFVLLTRQTMSKSDGRETIRCGVGIANMSAVHLCAALEHVLDNLPEVRELMELRNLDRLRKAGGRTVSGLSAAAHDETEH